MNSIHGMINEQELLQRVHAMPEHGARMALYELAAYMMYLADSPKSLGTRLEATLAFFGVLNSNEYRHPKYWENES